MAGRFKRWFHGKRTIGIPAAILLMFAGFVAWWTPGIDVRIANNGDVPIRDVSLRFRGGAKYIPLILPEQSLSVNIQPRGKSGLQFEFTRGTDDYRTGAIDVYMERDYSGTVLLRVGRDGAVTYRERIKVRWYVHMGSDGGYSGTIKAGG
jgi:hypothetical protein